MHHKGPNLEGYDPDIGPGAIAFTPGIVAQRTTGFAGWFVKRQGWLFFPLLTLEGLNLHAESIRAARDTTSNAAVAPTELWLVVTRLVGVRRGPAAVPAAGQGGGVLRRCRWRCSASASARSFAPAHKGMPIVPPELKLDFLRRQVMVSRNVRGDPPVDCAMGGLNYQIEHHLFPSMPRCNLRKAQPFVKAHCEDDGVDYIEVGLFRSYGDRRRLPQQRRHPARGPFDCPLTAQYRT